MNKDLIFTWDLGCNCWKTNGLNNFFVYLASFEPKVMNVKHLHEVFESMGEAKNFFQEKYHCRLKFRDPTSKLEAKHS